MQISQAREQYIRWLVATKDLSPHTIRAYDGDIATFHRHLGARTPVNRIAAECVVGFIEEQRAAGLSGASIRRRASGVRGFCKWLHSSRLIENDPWVGATFAGGRGRKLPRVLSANDLERLFRWLHTMAARDEGYEPHNRLRQPNESTTLLAVALMVGTGVRVSEVVSIRCQDIELPTRRVRIMGKGRRERHVFLPNGWIVGLMRAYLGMRATLGFDYPQLLFNRRLEPLTATAMRLRLRKAAADAGLRIKVTPHMLRHTAATQLIEAGVDIRYIQRLLGHASLTTTEIYTHVSDDALKRVISEANILGSFPRCR